MNGEENIKPKKSSTGVVVIIILLVVGGIYLFSRGGRQLGDKSIEKVEEAASSIDEEINNLEAEINLDAELEALETDISDLEGLDLGL